MISILKSDLNRSRQSNLEISNTMLIIQTNFIEFLRTTTHNNEPTQIKSRTVSGRVESYWMQQEIGIIYKKLTWMSIRYLIHRIYKNLYMVSKSWILIFNVSYTDSKESSWQANGGLREYLISSFQKEQTIRTLSEGSSLMVNTMWCGSM